MSTQARNEAILANKHWPDEITNSENVIDSREIEERIKYLRDTDADDAYTTWQTATVDGEPDDEYCGPGLDARADFDAWWAAMTPELIGASFYSEWEDELTELRALETFREAVNSSEWNDGLTLIRDDHFEDYAREFASDIGAIKDDATWPYTCIDWERAANDMRQDYSSAEFDGVTYWYRS